MDKNNVLIIGSRGTVGKACVTLFEEHDYTVIGTMLDYDKFEINTQNATGSYTGVVNGSGYLNGSNMAINLTKQGVDYFANCNK